MTAQKQIMAMGFSRREARHIRRLGQMRWKDFFRDPKMIKGRARERIEYMVESMKRWPE